MFWKLSRKLYNWFEFIRNLIIFKLFFILFNNTIQLLIKRLSQYRILKIVFIRFAFMYNYSSYYIVFVFLIKGTPVVILLRLIEVHWNFFIILRCIRCKVRLCDLLFTYIILCLRSMINLFLILFLMRLFVRKCWPWSYIRSFAFHYIVIFYGST